MVCAVFRGVSWIQSRGAKSLGTLIFSFLFWRLNCRTDRIVQCLTLCSLGSSRPAALCYFVETNPNYHYYIRSAFRTANARAEPSVCFRSTRHYRLCNRKHRILANSKRDEIRNVRSESAKSVKLRGRFSHSFVLGSKSKLALGHRYEEMHDTLLVETHKWSTRYPLQERDKA